MPLKAGGSVIMEHRVEQILIKTSTKQHNNNRTSTGRGIKISPPPVISLQFFFQ